MHSQRTALAFTVLILAFARIGVAPTEAVTATVSAQSSVAVPTVASRSLPEPTDALKHLPLLFIRNNGQVDSRTIYHVQGSRYAFWLLPDRLLMKFAARPESASGRPFRPTQYDGAVLALRFVGADPHPRVGGTRAAAARVNYARGNDPDRWQMGVEAHSEVVYRDLWPGIDMVLSGRDGQLKYEFHLDPGADPDKIRLRYDGAQTVRLGRSGELLIQTAIGHLRDAPPVSLQRIDGRDTTVESRYVVAPEQSEYGFELGSYDRDAELIIDPSLDFSTFLGGASDDDGYGIAVDASGQIYVVGTTQSTDFPTTPGAVDRTFNGGIVDVFVAKLSADGSSLVYATYLGGVPTPLRRGPGDPIEHGRAIAVDNDGNAYIAGQTTSSDFPVTSGAFQTQLNVLPIDQRDDATDGFVAKLGPTGALIYSTYLGGTNFDDADNIAIDAAGNAHVTGRTLSTNFPTTLGAAQTTHAGGFDGFFTKLNSSGSGVIYSTFLGGADNETTDGVAVDASGHVYVAGATRSVDFPTTPGSFQPVHSGGGFLDLFEVFVTKLDPTSGGGLEYSTFIGGPRQETTQGLAIDSAGSAYVVGGTLAPDFPTTPGAFDTVFDGTSESFVVKLDPTGSELVFATFLGAGGAAAVTVDAGNNVWLAGGAGPGAPTTPDAVFGNRGGNDAWIGKLDPSGSELLFATFVGGIEADFASGIALDAAESPYVIGTTFSADFPTTAGAFDRTFDGDPTPFWGDTFVLKIDLQGVSDPFPSVQSFSATPSEILEGESAVLSWTTTDADSVSIDGGATQPADGSISVSPATTTTYTLAATGSGGTASARLTVTVNPPVPVLAGVSVNPTTVAGGGSATGTVTLSAAQSGATVVALSTPAPASVATIPASVTVPAGATSATFTISTAISTSTLNFNMNIFASLAGSPGQSALLIITPTTATAISTIVLNPTTVAGGATSNATVTLNAAAPSGGAVVNLASNNAAAAVPASVTVAAGATGSTFSVTTSSVTVVTTPLISATFNGGTRSANLTVNPLPPGPPTVDSFTATPTTLTAGESSRLSWTTTDADSVSINGGVSLPAAGNTSVSPSVTTTYTLTATGPGGSATASVDVTVQGAPPTGSDFKTQMVKVTIPAGASTTSSSAFEPVDPNRTVALISGVTQHAMGWTAEANQDPVEMSAYVALDAGGGSLSATRASTINQSDTVWVLLIEYVGPAGGSNEFVVRDRRVHGWSGGETSAAYGPIGSVANANRVVVFGAGASNTNTASSGFDRADVRGWMDAARTVQLVRGDGTGAISSSHQVVEFVGSDWTIQTGDSAPSQDPGGADVAIGSVGDVASAWVYFTWSTNSANLDERGHRLWLTSPTNLRVQEDAAATASKTIRWFVISNPNLQVQSGAADDVLTSTNTGTINGFVPVADMARSFAWVTGMTDGGGNAHPRDMWQFELADAATIGLQRGRTGQELSHRYFVVELPSGGAAPGPPSVDTFGATPATITEGGASTLSWTTTGADSVSINGGASLPPAGSTSVSPAVTTTYTLTATGTGGTASASVSVTVDPATPSPPTITSFSASPTTIAAGRSTTLTWTTTGANGVSINGGTNLPVTGTSSVSPTVTTNYILTATGLGGSATASVTVQVTAPQDIASLTLNPTTIAGGSGDSSTGTVTLNAPAPAGGVTVTLTSSNAALAATLPSLTVPAGATQGTFTVATNSRYRKYSGLAFTPTISATLASTRSATLAVTAAPPPPDITSGVAAGDQTQWEGLMCGGIAPIGGNPEILYNCSLPTQQAGQFGSCTFQQECSIGCRRVPPSAGGGVFTFNDFCATDGPNAVSISSNYIISGDRVPSSLIAEAPVAAGSTQGLPGTIGEQGGPGAIDGLNANASVFPHDGGITFPTGTTSVDFDLATSYVPSTTFQDVIGFWFDQSIPPFLITNGRGGHAWLTMAPPDPAPALPIPTLGDFKITGFNPVTGGQSSIGQIDVSGISSGGGPTITLASSHPSIASVPATFVMPASTVLGQQVPIATQAPAVDTDVTITATDGRYTFSATLLVRAAAPPPVLAGVSVNPTTVVGGGSATGTVTLSAAQSGATVVTLSTPAPASVATMPASVTVPAGATSATFTISTAINTSTLNFNMNVFADLAGSPGQSALLIITPTTPTAISAFVLNPTSVTGGASSIGTVTLNAAAPSGGAVVNVASDNAAATVPASVTVPAGATSASFTITTSSVTVAAMPLISATFNGGTWNSVLTVNPPAPGPPSVDTFGASPTTITEGDTSTLSWTTTDATSVSINGASQELDGNLQVSPTTTTSYTLTATGAGGTATASVTVTVNPAPPGPPTVDSFGASPTTITEGDTSTLSWTTTDADSVSINGGGSLLANASTTVSPTVTTTYTLTATGAGGTATASVTVTVNPAPPGPPTVDSFTASPATITEGSASTLSWTTTDADSVSINGGAPLAADGSTSVSPAVTTTYTLTATGAGGTATASVTVTVNPAPPGPPTVDSFTASPATITEGSASTLSWTTTDADSVSINGGGSLAANRSTSVSPTTTTTYTLTATGAGGTATASVTVTVNPAPPGPPTVDTFSASPATITEGGSSTLSWTTTDADSVSINGGGSLAADGSTSVSPVVTTTYTLTATGAGGTATSSVTVTVNSTAPPQGSVSISGPTSINRGDRTSFTLTLTNTGSSTISGATLTFNHSPGNLLKDVSPGSSVSVGDVAPGASVSQTWNVRGDNEGSGNVTASATSGGATLDTATQSLTVIK